MGSLSEVDDRSDLLPPRRGRVTTTISWGASLSSRPSIRDRYSFANLEEALPLPDLIAIQRESFDWFLEQGLADPAA